MRYKLYGLVAIGLIAGIVALMVGVYTRSFTSAVFVVVQADRAGLLMDKRADVTMRGVTVGEVRDVDLVDGVASLTVALDPEQAGLIPGDVTAEIVAPTVFGTKYVELVPDESPSPEPIAAGAVIPVTRNQAEINHVFEQVTSLLSSIDVARLNTSLGAMSTSLQGRGDLLGDVVQQLDAYLLRLRPSVPTMQRDISLLADVSDVYAAAASDLFTIADNTSSISDTLVQEELKLHAFLLDLTGLAGNAHRLVADNEHGLRQSLDTLAPVTALAARYSPMFTCLLNGTNQLRKAIEPKAGGDKPGLALRGTFQPGTEGYQYPRDLPQVGAFNGPSCYGGPLRPGDEPPPHIDFDDGSHAYGSRSDALEVGDPPVGVQLFGPRAASPSPKGGR